jgi:hypothetical protein
LRPSTAATTKDPAPGDLDGQNTALTVGGMARDLVGGKRQIYELAALDQIQMCEANFGQSANMLPQDS